MSKLFQRKCVVLLCFLSLELSFGNNCPECTETGPENVVQELITEKVGTNITNAGLTEMAIKTLQKFYPKLDFIVGIYDKRSRLPTLYVAAAGRSDNTLFGNVNKKSFFIYFTRKNVGYRGALNCYGGADKVRPYLENGTYMCNSDLNPALGYIGDICGKVKDNPESVGFRAVIREDLVAIRSTLPEFAFKLERVSCGDGSTTYGIVIALFQPAKAIIFEEELNREFSNNKTTQSPPVKVTSLAPVLDTNPEKIVKEVISENVGKSVENGRLAEKAIKTLQDFFPKLDFVVGIYNQRSRLSTFYATAAGRNENTFLGGTSKKSFFIYYTRKAVGYKGALNCYGGADKVRPYLEKCNSDLNPALGYIGDTCGKVKNNPESVGFRAIIREELDPAILSTLPEFAFKLEKFLCGEGNVTYDIIIALYQFADEIIFNEEINAEAANSKMKQSLTEKNALEAKTKNEKKIKEILLAIFIGVILICLAIFIICTIIYRRRLVWLEKVDRFRNQWPMANDQQQKKVALVEPNNAKLTEIDQNDYWELTWDKIKLMDEKLGSGAYGVVYSAVLTETPPSEAFLCRRARLEQSQNIRYEVAVKMLPKYATLKTREEFLREIEVMKSLGYQEHIVNMVGCITKGPAICMIQEYCANRDLLTYVQKLRNGDDIMLPDGQTVLALAKTFLGFLWQIAEGMRYLSSLEIIHRDLAARNVLLDAKNTAKISDFGLCIVNSKMLKKSVSSTSVNKVVDESSRNGQTVEDDQQTLVSADRLPIKWLAIESLKHRKFSEKSDIWSFGVLIYEMYSFGKVPFEGIKPHLMLTHLEEGNRLEKPEFCSDEIYQTTQNCCLENPKDRPTFNDLVRSFAILLEKATENYGYLSLVD